MSQPRLGEPVELPWWVVALGLPPLVVAPLGVILGAPGWARAMVTGASVLALLCLALIATRVRSRNLQSVWVSALYAVWVFVVVAWAVVLATPACRCA